MTAPLTGTTVLVTGGDSGIGAAIVRTCVEQGANVVINYLSDSGGAAELASSVTSAGPGRAISVQGDVTDNGELQHGIATAVREFGRIDVLVNNAGLELGKGLLDTSEDDFDHTVATNLRSVFFGTQLAARQFLRQGGGGLVVNVTSVHEDWPMPGNTAYCVAKGGVRMLTRTAGVELAAHGIRVVNVAPGAVDTPMNDDTTGDPDQLAALLDSIPLRRLAQPEDVARVVAFLAAPAAVYLNATTVVVDGGMMQRGSEL